jgi:hypothetical protein
MSVRRKQFLCPGKKPSQKGSRESVQGAWFVLKSVHLRRLKSSGPGKTSGLELAGVNRFLYSNLGEFRGLGEDGEIKVSLEE